MRKSKITAVFLAVFFVLAVSCKEEPPWQKGVELFKRGQYKRSIRYFRKAMETNPLHADAAYYMIGSAYIKTGEYEKATEAFSNIIEQKDTEELVKKYVDGMWYFNGGDFKSAMPIFEIIVHESPTYKNGNAFFYLIRSIKEVYGAGKAAEECFTGIRMFADHIDETGRCNLYNLYGSLLLELKDYAVAAEYFKKSLAIREDTLVLYNLGIAYENLGDYTSARQQFFSSYFADRKNDLAKWKFFGLLTLEEIEANNDIFKFGAQALNEFKRATEFFKKGYFEFFRDSVERALRMDFQIERLFYQYGQYALKFSDDMLFKANVEHYFFGNAEKAEAAYRNLPSGYARDLDYGILLIKAGRFDEAEAILRQMGSGDLDFRKHFYTGLMWYNRAAPEKALEEFGKAADLNADVISLPYFASLVKDASGTENYMMLSDFLLQRTKDGELKKWIAVHLKK